ncbi:hypothetical protein GT019_18010, partial [Paenibacillus sp. T1]|nr:hypothetical protein [Paenibacillus glycinis]
VAKIEALIAAANAVTSQIAALPDPAAIMLDNQAAVTSARTAFDALSASQQALVTNQTKLTQAEAKISTLIAAATSVTAQITALPDPAAITLDNQADVNAANAAFNALSTAQQDLVTNQAKLTQAVAKIEALIAAANAVTAQIAALPDPAAITLDNQAAVTSARTAFDALSASQQALVTNQMKLTQAEAKISSLIAAATAVTAQITALPDPAVITLDNQTDVTAANAAFNALSTAQQDLVTNQAKLTQAVATIEALIAAANAVTAQIGQLPDKANLQLSDKAAVVAASNAFNALSAAQQALVTNQSKLADALAQIIELEDQQAADAVIALIAALPAAANLTLSDEAAVNGASSAFNALTATRQDLVTNKSKLTDALARMTQLKADKAAADAVIAQIAALPATASLALSDETAVTAANTAYSALSADQRNLVTNQTKLSDAVARIGVLKAEHEADVQAAAVVTQQINDLPALADLTLSDKTAVAAARSAFEALTSVRQALVTNVDMLVQAEARIAELRFLPSKALSDFDFETIYATQARGESVRITDTNFQSHPVSFTISDGNVVIPVELNWDIPLNGFTTGQAVGSAVDSFIQQYCNDHHIDLGQRTLAAMGFDDTFYIMTFATGTQASVTLGGGYSAFFADNHFTGTNEDMSKNRTFTVSDGTQTATIILEWAYYDMDDFIADLNWQLQNANVQAVAAKIDATHFKLSSSTATGTLAIDGADKAQFFDAFQLD